MTSSAPVGRATIADSCVAHLLGEPERLERRRLARLVEQPHRHGLALDRRQRRDADVEQAAGRGGVQRDAAVLRLAPLGDVELREHLQARRHAGVEPLRDPLGDVEDAVDAEADDERVLLRLEVDVARALLGGLEDDRVDEPDERRVRDPVVGLEVVASSVLRRPPRLRPSTRAALSASEARREAAQLGQHVVLRGDVELDRMARREPQLVEPAHVLRVGDRDPAASRRRTRTGSRRRARAPAARSPSPPRRRRRRRRGRRAAGGTARRASRATPSELAKPSSISACENEPPSARARTCLELVRRQQPGLADHLRDELAVVAALGRRRRRRRRRVVSSWSLHESQVWLVVEFIIEVPPLEQAPGTRRGAHSPAKRATTPPSARNGPNGIPILRAACRAGRAGRPRARARAASRSSARPGRCARASTPSSSASLTSPIPIPAG